MSIHTASERLSVLLPTLADLIEGALKEITGQHVPFVLVLQVDEIAQYIANVKREDGKAIIEELLARWKAGRADIPAHYNPNLPKGS